MLLTGDGIEAVVHRLRSEQLSKMDSISVLTEAMGITLNQAKALVHLSEAWKDHREADESTHARAEEAIRALRPQSVELDRVADAAYISLQDDKEMRSVAWTYSCDPKAVRGMINLDFDSNGRLVGIEVINARSKLPRTLIERATHKGISPDK
jgi:uncharacterized protein YuzE